MEAVRRLASLARAAREERELRVRQPLARMQVAVPAAARGPALDELLELLRLEVNVKAVEVVASDTDLVRLRAKPNFRSLGKRYGKRTPAVAAAAERLTPEQLRGLERGETATLEVDGEPATFLPEDVVVEREVASDWLVASDGPYVAALDPRLDDDAPARRAGARGGEPGAAAPEGSGLRLYRPDRALDRGGRTGARGGARRTRSSSRARRWPGGWSWASGRRRPIWSRSWTSTGMEW